MNIGAREFRLDQAQGGSNPVVVKAGARFNIEVEKQSQERCAKAPLRTVNVTSLLKDIRYEQNDCNAIASG
jgi:hypothetical protein